MMQRPRYDVRKIELPTKLTGAAIELDCRRLGNPIGYRAVHEVGLLMRNSAELGLDIPSRILLDSALMDYPSLVTVSKEFDNAEHLPVGRTNKLRDFCSNLAIKTVSFQLEYY